MVGQLFLFRLADHAQRLRESASLLHCAELPATSVIVATAAALLRDNDVREDAYVRTLVYKGIAGFGSRLDQTPSDLCMYAVPMASSGSHAKPISLGTSTWRRVPDAAIPARAKLCGAYVNNMLARTEARQAGFADALCLDERGHVAEGTSANIFVVRNGRLYTPTVADDILEGITRRTVIELANELGYEIVERSIDRSELWIADEIFMCGTAWEIVPVGAIDPWTIGSGDTGPVTRHLESVFREVVRGRVPEWQAHCHAVRPV